MEEVLAVRDAFRAQQWAMLIQECNSSGLTKRAFCRQRGISEKSFYYWLRKMRSQMAEAAAPQLVQLEPISQTEDMLQIRYRGAELKLPADVDLDAVAALLRSIASLPVVTVGSIPGAYDIFVNDDGGNSAVKAIKKLYESGGIQP